MPAKKAHPNRNRLAGPEGQSSSWQATFPEGVPDSVCLKLRLLLQASIDDGESVTSIVPKVLIGRGMLSNFLNGWRGISVPAAARLAKHYGYSLSIVVTPSD